MIVEMLSWLLLAAGAFFVLVGAIGLLRMPDLYTRMHAASVAESMGALLILLGLMLQAGWSLAVFKLLAILLFLLFTSPTAAYALINTALLSGRQPRLVRDSESERTP